MTFEPWMILIVFGGGMCIAFALSAARNRWTACTLAREWADQGATIHFAPVYAKHYSLFDYGSGREGAAGIANDTIVFRRGGKTETYPLSAIIRVSQRPIKHICYNSKGHRYTRTFNAVCVILQGDEQETGGAFEMQANNGPFAETVARLCDLPLRQDHIERSRNNSEDVFLWKS